MSSDNTLSLGSNNFIVSEFVSLINDALVVADSINNDNKLGAVSTFSNAITKHTINAAYKLNNRQNNYKYSSNSYYNSGYSNNNKLNADYNKHVSAVSQVNAALELTRDIYDMATSVPESRTVSLYKDSSSGGKLQYGTFLGGTVFKDFNGTIDGSIKSLSPTSGWITINHSSGDYVWLSSGNNTYIVPVSKVQPSPTISDFQPLYDVLKNNQYSLDDTVVNDTNAAQSLATTFKDTSSELINLDSEDTVKYTYGSSNLDDNKFTYALAGMRTSAETEGPIKLEKPYKYKDKDIVYPQQIEYYNNDKVVDNVYNNVQAVVYDLPTGNEKQMPRESITMLMCFQQPDNISYTAACQFDSPAPRGSQQPFQFYIAGNAMNLSFTLKWHIDEIRTLAGEGANYSIGDIAQIAEDFTRPWKRGNSIEPKLCKVILPGVQHIGYITEAQVSYSGDMSGDYSTASGLKSGVTTNYFYSQIDVTFSMIIIKDINLKSKNDARKIMTINTNTAKKPPEKTKEEKEKEAKEKEKEKKEGLFADLDATTTSAVSSADTSNSPVDEVSSSDGLDTSDVESDTSPDIEFAWDMDDEGNVIIMDNYGGVYSSKGRPKGFAVSDDGIEIFWGNGAPQIITKVDNEGNKYYLDGNSEYVKAEVYDSDSVQLNE